MDRAQLPSAGPVGHRMEVGQPTLVHGFGLVCAVAVAGVQYMVTDGVQGFLVGGPMFVIGVAILALVIRHFRKPIRPPDPIVRKHDPWDDEAPPKGWPQLR